ncbi:MAG: hypothetical protein H6657_14555 [Ardenticatenaceae bacterium]|nr:hypothetical protein [Ardenticatenaceae bacterium]
MKQTKNSQKLVFSFLFLLFLGLVPSLAALTQYKITPADGAAGDAFGEAVDTDGQRVIIGAPEKDNTTGAAYIFEWDGNQYIESAKLVASDAVNLAKFGEAVSIHGDIAAVGAYNVNLGAGAVYIFEYDGASWQETAKLIASDAASQDNFGYSIALDGDTLLVGARANEDFGNFTGAAYIFERSNGSWTETNKLLASDASTNSWFGWDVDLAGDVAIVGAPKNNSVGAGYIFRNGIGGWGEEAKLTPASGSPGDNFGEAVGISGDNVVVGASDALVGTVNTGAAYVFSYNIGNWSQTAMLLGSDVTTEVRFGDGVDIDGSTILVGARLMNGRGAYYVYEFDNGWSETEKVSIGSTLDQFAWEVALADGVRVAGALGDDDNGSVSGSAYVYGEPMTPTSGSLTIAVEADPTDGTDFTFYGLLSNSGLGNITTIAGDGTANYSGDGGSAELSQLQYPHSVALDSAGNLYISDKFNHRIRKVDSLTGIITTVAGTGVPGYSGDGGQATTSQINRPHGIFVDALDNLYITDELNQRIRKVDLNTGIITTVAGNGVAGFSGDGGPAISSSLSAPKWVTVDSAGNIYIADSDNHRIRRVEAGTGTMTTFVGTGTGGYNGDNILAINAQINRPVTVIVDEADNVYISDYDNNRIRKVDILTGLITTVVGNGTRGSAGDGGLAVNAQVDQLHGINFDASGNLYIADTYNHRIRRVDAMSGIISTVAGDGTQGYSGDGGPSVNAQLNYPHDIVFDSHGDYYIAGHSNHVVRKVIVEPISFILDDANPDDMDGVAQNITYTNVPPGIYEISEVVPQDWLLVGAICTGGNDSGTLIQNDLTIQLDPGEEIHCTFSNEAEPTVAVPTVCLYESDGITGIADAQVQYYAAGWQIFGDTGQNGCVAKTDLPLGSYTFRISYGGASIDQVQNLNLDPLVIFQTVEVTVQLEDSNSDPLDIGNVQYYASGWKTFGTTTGGQVSLELLPRNYSFRMYYAGASVDLVQNVSTDSVVIFQTTNVTVRLEDSNSDPLDTGTVQYYASGWKTFGTTIGGQVSLELLPSNYSFRMYYAGASVDATQNVASDPLVIFQTGAVFSTSGAVTSYYAGGWQTFINGMELLPKNYSFRFNNGTPDTTYEILAGTNNTLD